MSLKILMTDDEPSTQKLARSLGVPLGHTIFGFDNGPAALQQAEGKRFDLAFVGAQTPGMNALELIRGVRDSQPNRDAFIVLLMTPAADGVETMRKAFGEGADLAVSKPISPSRLRALLAAMDSPGWKNQRHSARLPLFTRVICTSGGREAVLRSLNISETGIFLQGALDAEVDQEVKLDFEITEVSASLRVNARIARKDSSEEIERVAAEFSGLTREAQNAIQLYVLGRMKDTSHQRHVSALEGRKLFHP